MPTNGNASPFYTRSAGFAAPTPAKPLPKVASKPSPATAMRGAGKTPSRGLMGWVRVHRALSASVATVLVVSVAVGAALLIRQDITTSATAATPPVIFANGGDYTGINAAGFATITLGSSATSATFAFSAVPGAAQTVLGDVLKITNQHGTDDFIITLTRSGAVDADITTLSMDIDNGATDVETWNVLGGAATTPYTLPAGESLDLSLTAVLAAGVTGAQGSFTIQVSIAPA